MNRFCPIVFRGLPIGITLLLCVSFTWAMPGKKGTEKLDIITVSGPALNDGTYGAAYSSVQFTAGGGTPDYTFSGTNLPPGMSLSTTGVLSGTPTATGTYLMVITVTDAAADIGFNTFSLVIDPATLTIQPNNQTMYAGDPLPTLTYSITGFVNNDNASVLLLPPTISTTATPASPAGNYPISASGGLALNYTFTYGAATLVILPPLLTITANPASSPYGAALSTLTVSYSGFRNGDGPSSMTTAPTLATTASSTAPVGSYTITPSGAVNPNYTIKYVNGIYTISPATLYAQADNKTMNYGSAVPNLTITYTGFANGDNVSVLTTQPTISTTATSASPVGTYPITVTGGTAANYTVYPLPGVLTIQPVTLTVTANNQTMTYGGTVPAYGITYSGFVNGDNIASLTKAATATSTAGSAPAAGTYPITPAGAVDPNYTFSYVTGTLTVNPASLQVTARAATKVYGAADPAFTYTVSGFVNGNNSSILTGSLSRNPGEDVGTYPIIQGTLSAGNNYTIDYTGNNLTITKASQHITWVQSLLSGCDSNVRQIILTGTDNSGLSIVYTSSDSSIASITGDTLTLGLPGTAVITASQPGDGNHTAAASVIDSIDVKSSSLVREHWNDVLLFDNTSNEFVQWQWYKNGSAIPGATNDYYSESPSLNGQYYVIATESDGQQVQTCPLTISSSTTYVAGIKVFPNPVNSGQSATITLNYTTAALQGALLQIIDMTGKTWKQVTNVQPTMQVTMPTAAGIYVINLVLSNGQKSSVNVLVNN